MREEVRARDAAVEKTSVLDLTFFEMFFDDDEAELLRIADEALPSDEAKPPQIVEAGPGHIPRHEEQRAPDVAGLAKARDILLRTQAAFSTAQKDQAVPTGGLLDLGGDELDLPLRYLPLLKRTREGPDRSEEYLAGDGGPQPNSEGADEQDYLSESGESTSDSDSNRHEPTAGSDWEPDEATSNDEDERDMPRMGHVMSIKEARIRGRRQVQEAARPTKRAATDMLSVVTKWKWRVNDAMFDDELHRRLRAYASEEFRSMPNYQAHSVRAALTADNKLLPSAGEDSNHKRLTILAIAEVIPPAALVAMTGKQTSALTVEDALTAIEAGMGHMSSVGFLQSVKGFMRFWHWMKKNNIVFDDLTAIDVQKYYKAIHAQAVGDTDQGMTPKSVLLDVAAEDEDGDDERDDTEEILRRAAKGITAANGQRSLLIRLQKNLQFCLHAFEPVPAVDKIRFPKKHATPVCPAGVGIIQDFVANDKTSAIMANIGGAFLLSHFSTSRTRQLQRLILYAEGPLAAGGRARKKDPRPSGKTQDTLIYLRGVRGNATWFTRWKQSLRGVRPGNFAYRDYDFVDNNGDSHPCTDPRIANRQLNCALPEWKVTPAIRFMLQEATGLPAHEVQCTTKHSGRTFLPHTSKERDEPMDSQLELAGWFGSSVALDGLPAKEFERYSDLLLQSRTPNGYASQSTFDKVFRTVQGNCEAVNEALGETLPILSKITGGFDKLRKHQAYEAPQDRASDRL